MVHRVLLVSHYSDRYGANRSLCDLAVKLRIRGVESFVVLPTMGAIEQDLLEENIPFFRLYYKSWTVSSGTGPHRIRSFAVMAINLIADIRLALLARRLQIDLIHINSSCTPVGFLASRWLKVPLVWHIREYLEEDYGISFLDPKAAFRNIGAADKVIAVSHDLALKYQSLLGTKLGVIHNGVRDVAKRPRNQFRQTQLRLLMVGVLDRGKGHQLAIRALAIAKQELGLDVRLVVVGSGDPEFAKELRKLTFEFDLQEDVEFLGYLKDLRDLRASSDIGLICSSREAFGRVTIEAMTAGLLVVASRSGGTCEIVQDGKTGLLFESGDPLDLALCLKWIHDNPTTSIQIANSGQQHARRHFNMDRVADEVLGVYDELKQRSVPQEAEISAPTLLGERSELKL